MNEEGKIIVLTVKILKYPSEREILGSRQELAPNSNRATRLDKARPTQLA